jgi:hypothetical protein
MASETQKAVVIKDTWRYDVEDIRKEGDIYAKLCAEPNPVKNIPIVLDAGDVPGQATRVSDYDDRSDADKVDVTLTRHVHHRIFFETVGFPLKTWRNAKQLVRLIRDSIEGER